jgi:hypothetical protein
VKQAGRAGTKLTEEALAGAEEVEIRERPVEELKKAPVEEPEKVPTAIVAEQKPAEEPVLDISELASELRRAEERQGTTIYRDTEGRPWKLLKLENGKAKLFFIDKMGVELEKGKSKSKVISEASLYDLSKWKPEILQPQGQPPLSSGSGAITRPAASQPGAGDTGWSEEDLPF